MMQVVSLTANATYTVRGYAYCGAFTDEHERLYAHLRHWLAWKRQCQLCTRPRCSLHKIFMLKSRMQANGHIHNCLGTLVFPS